MLWHKEKGAKINNSSVTRFTCIYEILSNHPIQNRFLKNYSGTCKDRQSTDIIHEIQASTEQNKREILSKKGLRL